MRLSRISFSLATAAVLLAAAAADARPRRVVVADFDGPRALADLGRSTILSLLGDEYDVVATRRWETARAEAPGHGPQQWRQAAKRAGVDAVIVGWVEDEGRHHVLTIAVREAATGREIDSISVPLGARGTSPQTEHQLAAQLDDIMSWIDGDSLDADPSARLPDVHLRPRHARRRGRDDRRTFGRGDRDDRGFDRSDRRDGERARDDRGDRHGRDDDRGDRADRRDDDRGDRADRRDDDRGDRADPRDKRDERADRMDDDRRDGDRSRDRDDDTSSSRTRGAGSPFTAELVAARRDRDDTSALVQLFGPDTQEAAIVTDEKTPHVPRPTPRFQIDAGAYLASRGMTLDYDPNAEGNVPSYPASPIKGLAVGVSVYPLPHRKMDGEPSGIGFSLALEHSVGSYLTAMDDTGYGDYTMNQSAWEAGVHYRWPSHLLAIDAHASYGNLTHTIVDLPQSIAIPDTAYQYLGLGADLDLHVTERSTVGFGARYLYMLATGDISSEDWYGAGTAWGLALDGNFTIPVTRALYVKGTLEYRRIKVDFEGSGTLAMEWGVWDAIDSSIAGRVALGVQF